MTSYDKAMESLKNALDVTNALAEAGYEFRVGQTISTALGMAGSSNMKLYYFPDDKLAEALDSYTAKMNDLLNDGAIHEQD